MNEGQLNDRLCYLCLGGAVVSFPFFMQEVMGSRLALFINKILNEFTEFSESHLGKSPMSSGNGIF